MTERGLLRQGRQAMPAELAGLWLLGRNHEALWPQAHADCGYRLKYCNTEAQMLARVAELLRAAGVTRALPADPHA